MDPVFERRALDAFEQALEWPPGERARRLKQALGAEPALHAAVLELFAADAAGTGSLPTDVPEPVAAAPLPPPPRVGVYRVGELLGEGGMGAVYRGERDDGLFAHTVAIKLIRPNLLSAQVHARFATERQILASLRHPNIAQLFDAGIDGEGRPWLLMELLEGQPIDAWVAARRPGERRLIGLLRQVCAAVQHAHQNLVVHADIKPSNIVVSTDGHVKLLDFGIAQLIAPDGEAEAPDAVAPRPLTRAYASPEQRAGEVPKPAADVYAIGVLMHQLFAGELPRESTETVVMPVRDLRGAELPGQLPGDLGYIIAKAMHTDPGARYATVAEIVTDLNRYLDHEPVSARRADVWYTGRCFVRRHRWRLALGGVVATALVATTVISTSLYLRADRARAAAAARFDETRSMAKFMLFQLHDDLARLPGTTEARRLLAAESRAYLEALAAVPDAPVGVTLEAAIGYRKLAQVLGAPGQPNLGDVPGAYAALDAGDRLLTRLRAARPGDGRVLLEAARNRITAGRIHYLNDSTVDQSTALNEAGLALLAELLARDPRNPGGRVWQQAALAWGASDLDYAGRHADALDRLARVRAVFPTLPEDPDDPLFRTQLDIGVERLTGDTLYFAGRRADAADAYGRAERLVLAAMARHGAQPALTAALALVQWSLGGTLTELDRHEEALRYIEQAEDATRRVLELGPDASSGRMLGILANQKAEILTTLGRYEAAAAIYTRRRAELEAAAARQPAVGGPARDLAVVLMLEARNDLEAGELERGCARLGAALDQWTRIGQRWGLAPLDAAPLAGQRAEHAARCGTRPRAQAGPL